MDVSEGRPPLLYPGPRIALLRRFARLSVTDLHALEAQITTLARDKANRGKVDRGFWFAWDDRMRSDYRDRQELDILFSDVVTALASGLSGFDVDRLGTSMLGGRRAEAGSGAFGGLMGLIRPKSNAEQRQEVALNLIRNATAPWDPRLAIMACWNVACAVALRERLRPGTVALLEAAWRGVFGELPI